MPKDETTTEAGQENTVEATTTTETTTVEPTSTKADPLDGMDDSALRAFALGKEWKVDDTLAGADLLSKIKERRSIAQRHNGQQPPKEATNEKDDKDVVRVSDLEKREEQTAKESLEEASDPVLADIRDNWSDIAGYYTPRHGRTTSKAILKDMRIARAAYREANPLPEGDGTEAAAAVATTTGKGGTSPKNTTEQPKKHVIPKRQSVDDWYPKKED